MSFIICDDIIALEGKIKKIADFDCPVVDISIGLDGSLWLITENDLYLLKDRGVVPI